MMRLVFRILVIALYCASGACMAAAAADDDGAATVSYTIHVTNDGGTHTRGEVPASKEATVSSERGGANAVQERVMNAVRNVQAKSESITALCEEARKDSEVVQKCISETEVILGELGAKELHFLTVRRLSETARKDAAATAAQCMEAGKNVFQARVEVEKVLCETLRLLREVNASMNASEAMQRAEAQLQSAENHSDAAKRQLDVVVDLVRKARGEKAKAISARDIANEMLVETNKFLERHAKAERERRAKDEEKRKAAELGAAGDGQGLNGSDGGTRGVPPSGNESLGNNKKGHSSESGTNANCSWAFLSLLLFAAFHCLAWS